MKFIFGANKGIVVGHQLCTASIFHIFVSTKIFPDIFIIKSIPILRSIEILAVLFDHPFVGLLKNIAP